ncbi:transketolase family protein [Pacificoceanicola onchidii]|uniref:transketolase family protein n=1 Tax=Pacificoceanicola onchidii TaxID=2562685 RepID=UPI0010A6818E|nr:transketolase C-terminal domain-containing protein [Pacificoceanicola onchidii]
MEMVSNPHAHNIVAFAKDRPDVVVLSGDLTVATECHKFREAYPERFFGMGMAEQNMLSWAGGMAREGLKPFIHTFSVFLYRRPYDQLQMSVAYPNLPVRLVGFLPGLDTPGGVTHQSIEDIAALRPIPNMTIFEAGDATDIESLLDLTDDIPGPVYLRMLRGEVPRLFDADKPTRFNTARVLSEGSDITLITSGRCTEEAMRATSVIRQRGVSIKHLHVTTLKPFTDPVVLEALGAPGFGIITMENHVRIGGLGGAVAEMMTDHGVGKRLVRIGIDDTYCSGATLAYLMRKHEIDALALVHRVEEMISERLNISEDDLAAARIDDVKSRSTEQLEAL